MDVLLVLVNGEMDFEAGQNSARTVSNLTAPAPQGSTALLEALGQQLLGALGPLLFLLLDILEESRKVLIAASIARVLLIQVRPLEGVIEYADEIVGSVFGAGPVGHG
jgi:hypothetical protein